MANLRCNGTTNQNGPSIDLTGLADLIPATNTLGFLYGTTMGGPYPNASGHTTAGSNTLNQPYGETIGGLSGNTTYYYVPVEYAADGTTIIDTGAECTWDHPDVPPGIIGPVVKSTDLFDSNITSGTTVEGNITVNIGGIDTVDDFFLVDLVPTVPAGITRTWEVLSSSDAVSGMTTGQTGTGDINFGPVEFPPGGGTLGGEGDVDIRWVDTIPAGAVGQYDNVVTISSATADQSGAQQDTVTRYVSDGICPTATNITHNSASVADASNGAFVPGGTYIIRWGTVSGGPYPNDSGNVGAFSTANLTGLTPSTQYFFIQERYNGSGQLMDTTAECTPFTTEAAPPSFNPVCNPAAAISNDYADLSGTADNVPADHTIEILWGTTSGGPYPNTAAVTVAGDTTVGQAIASGVNGLDPSTDYYYVVSVKDASDTEVDVSSECTFTSADSTTVSPIECDPATGISDDTATLNAHVDGSLDVGDVVEIGFSETAGGPYLFGPEITPNGSIDETFFIGGPIFSPGTQYFYVARVLDGPGGAVLDTSDECTFTTTGTASDNVTLTKETDPGPYVVGDNITSTVTVTNTGFSTVASYIVDDPIPVGVARSWTAVGTGGATGFTASGSGSGINDTLNLPPGSQVVYTIVDTAQEVGTYQNVVTGTNDGLPPNGPVPGGPPVDVNDNIECEPATVITDTSATLNGSGINIPTDEFIRIVWGTTSGGPYSNLGSNVSGDGANSITVNENITGLTASTSYFYAVQLMDTDGTTVIKTTTECTFTTTAPSLNNVTLTKSTTPGPYVIGDTITSTVTVTNTGTTTITGYTVDDPIPAVPAGTTRTFTSTETGGATGNTASGTTDILDTLTLPASAVVTYTINDTITQTGDYVNNVTGTNPGFPPNGPIPGGPTEPVANNIECTPATNITEGGADIHGTAVNIPTNQFVRLAHGTTLGGPYPNQSPSVSGTDSTPITLDETLATQPPSTTTYYVVELLDTDGTTILRTSDECSYTTLAATVSDITLTKTTEAGPHYVGDTIVSTVTVTNTGTATVTGYVLTDPIPTTPAGTTRAFTATESGGATGFTASGTTDINDTLSLPGGSVVTYTIEDTPTQEGTYQNNVTGTEPGFPPNGPIPGGPPTDVGPATNNVTLTKTTTPGPYVVGDVISSVVTVINTGTGTVTGYILDDPIPASPAGTTRVFNSSVTGGATGNTASGITDILDTLNLPGGSTVTYNIDDTITEPGSYVNNVTGTNPGFPPTGPVPGGPEENVGPQITVTKTTPTGPYETGQAITSTLTVSNVGGTTATGVIISDIIPAAPAGTTRTFTASETGGVTGFTASGTTDINDTVTMPAGSVVTYTINDTPTAAGSYQNQATVTLPTGPPIVVNGGPPGTVTPPPVIPPGEDTEFHCKSDLVRLCRQTDIESFCDADTGTPILLVSVVAEDGDVIPTNSTEFAAGTNDGVFTTMGFFRSYYADMQGNYLTTQPTNISQDCLPPSRQEIRACFITEYIGFSVIEKHLTALQEAIDASGSATLTTNTEQDESGTEISSPITSADEATYLSLLNTLHGGGFSVIDGVLVQDPNTLTNEQNLIIISPSDDINNKSLHRISHLYKDQYPVKIIQELGGDPGSIEVDNMQIFYIQNGLPQVTQPFLDNQRIAIDCEDCSTEWQQCMLDRVVEPGTSTEIEKITAWTTTGARTVSAQFRTPEGTVHTVTVLSSSGNGILDPASDDLIRQGAINTHYTSMEVTVNPPFPSVTEVVMNTYDMDGPPTNNERMGNFSFGEGSNFTPPDPINYSKAGDNLFAYNGAGTWNGPEADFGWVFGGEELSSFSWTRRAVQGLNSFLSIEFFTQPTSYNTIEFTRVLRKDCNRDIVLIQDHDKGTGGDYILRDGAQAVTCSNANWQNIGETCFLDFSAGDGFTQTASHNFRSGDNRPGNITDHGDDAGGHWLNTINYCFGYEVESEMIHDTPTSVPWIIDPGNEGLYMFPFAGSRDIEWNLTSTNDTVLSRVFLEFEITAGGSLTFTSNLPDTVEVLQGSGTYTAPTFTSPTDTTRIRVRWFNWTGSEEFRYDNIGRITILNWGYDISFPTGERGLVSTQVDGITGEIRYINQATGRVVEPECLLQCPTGGLPHSDESVVLCDDNGSFIRVIENDGEGRRTVINYQLDGETLYTPVGTVEKCNSNYVSTEIGCLGDQATADLTSAARCTVDSVIINGEELDFNPNLEAGWSIQEFVDKVNEVRSGSLAFENGSVVALPGSTLGNLEIICVEIDFEETFSDQPGAGTNPGDGNISDLAGVGSTGTTTYTYDPSGDLNAGDSYHIGRVRDIRPGSYPILNMGGAPNDVDATGNVNGNVMVVNGSPTPGVFFSQTATGLIIGQEYQMRGYGANLNASNQNQNTWPAVTLELLEGATVIASDGGDLIPADSEWHTFTVRFVATSTSITFRATNSSPVINGNDLALDQITFSRISRSKFLFEQRGEQIPVEIVKVINDEGEIVSIRVYSADGQTEYALPDVENRVLSTGPCNVASVVENRRNISSQAACLTTDQGDSSSISIIQSIDLTGDVSLTYIALDGTPVTPATTDTITLGECISDSEYRQFCDNVTGQPFLRRFDISNGVVTTVDTFLDGITPYTLVGGAGNCPEETVDRELICYVTTANSEPQQAWARHDNSLVNVIGQNHIDPGGIAYFTATNPVQPLDLTQPGLQFVNCNNADIVSTQSTISRLEVVGGNTAATTTNNLRSVSIVNVGTTNAIVAGVTLLPAQTVEATGYFDYETQRFVRLASINYNPLNTTLHITELS